MIRLTRLCLPFLIVVAHGLPSSALAAPLDLAPDAVVGKPDFTTGAGGAATASRVLWASALAQDPLSGELWVADYDGNRVLRFASANAFQNGEAANLVLGQADFAGAGINRGGPVAANTLNRPAGLAVDEARRLYVADTENHRILVFHPPYVSGMNATVVAGQGNFTSGAANRGGAPDANTLNRPHGLALDASGALWVADMFNARVLRYSTPMPPGRALSPSAVLGQNTYLGNQPALTASGMSRPAGLTFDPDGNLWVADQEYHRVMRYPAASLPFPGSPATLVLCQANFTSNIAGVTDRVCFSPTGVAVDAAGRVYLADFGNSRVLGFGVPAGNGVGAVEMTGQAGFNDQLCNRNLGAPRADTLCGPRALALDRHANLLVADAGNGRVLRYDIPKTRPRPVISGAAPGVVVTGTGDFELTVNGRGFTADSGVRWYGTDWPTRYISPRRVVATIRGSVIPGGTGGSLLEVILPAPSEGNSNQPTFGTYDRVAGDVIADRVLGQADFLQIPEGHLRVGGASVGGVGAASFGEGALDVVIDRVSGRVFVSDASRSRVLSWPSHALFQNGASADVVIGQPDAFSTSCATPAANRLCSPAGMAVDASGRLYVSDAILHRVLRFEPPFATGMAASGVFGQGGSFTTGDDNKGGRSAGSLSRPTGLAASNGRLFVSDSGNARVLVFESPETDVTADIVIGQADMASSVTGTPSAARVSTDVFGLAVDGAGRLHVADQTYHRVLRFAPPFANGMAADLVIGQSDFASRNFGITESNLRGPRYVAADAAGNLLVSDSTNNRVLRFAAPLANGMAATGVLGQPDLSSGQEQADHHRTTNPAGVAIDTAGNVLVVGQGDQRVLSFDRPFGAAAATRLVNLSTRLSVGTGNDVLIGGFIIGGGSPKTVVVRARGPSLAPFGIANPLANPVLQLISGQSVLATSDDWQQAANAAGIQASGFAPSDARESAILTTLAPGAYTAIVSGAGGGTGVGIVEVFEVDGPSIPLSNISTRGLVRTGNDVMIGGFVIQGDAPQTVVIRARGPSLAPFGIANPLANPVLQLVSGQNVLATNDDWQQAGNAGAIQASGFAPADTRESAILVTLQPGAYTAIVSGAGGGTGVAIVEVFAP